MIHAHVPTNRPKLSWQDIIKSKEDYSKMIETGLAWVYFSDYPTPQEFKEYLESKENVSVAD